MALTQITEKGIKDGEIINADINASAAIAGTKIDPSFTSNITVTNTQPKIFLTDSNSTSDFSIQNENGNFNIYDETNSTSRVRIISTGQVGIGTSSPDRTIHCHNSSNTTNVRAKFSNGTTGEGASDGFEIGINASDPAEAVLVNYEASPIAFFTGGTERVRVDESGHMRFSGTTEEIKLNTSDGSDNGFLNLAGGGECSQLRGSQIVMYGNEYTGQQGQLLLMAGNSGNANGAIRFYTGGSERARVQADGGISFNGDTAAANALDDYEEGEHTFTTNSNLTANSSYNKADYTKVGNLITVTFLLYVQAVSGSDTVTVSMPFANRNESVPRMCQAVGNVMWKNINTGDAGLVPYLDAGSSTLKFYKVSDNVGWSALDNGDLNATDEMYVTITYKTAT